MLGTAHLVEHLGILRTMLPDHLGKGLLPLLEWAADAGSVEQHVLDLPPVVALVLPADDAHGTLERLAVEPQFAVERYGGQAGDEPVGSMIDVALPRKKLLAVPLGPHAVELLAHPPAGQVRVVVPRMGQEQLGCGVRVLFRGRRHCRGQGAEPLPFRLFAAIGSEVLAGAAFDGHRLISPRRAGAGIDAADVLELC